MTPVLRILSLGAGVQSSTLALMAARGEVGPMPTCAIFSDTGWEPIQVYTWKIWLETQLPFPVHTVSRGNLRADVLAQKPGSGLPLFTESPGGVGHGMLGRGCTRTYKVEPKRAKIRELIGYPGRKRIPAEVKVEQWFGISLDEVYRMKVPEEPWMTYRYPLVYDKPMTRQDCLRWMKDSGYPEPPRSACIGCPFHSDAEWRAIKPRPNEWADAVEFDAAIRTGVRNTREKCYVHPSLKPLDEVDLSTDEENGQLSLFTNECEGMCGV